MSDTPISEKEIEFAMAMFAACNPNRTGHLCKAMRMLERELNRMVKDSEEARSNVTKCLAEMTALVKERDEWKKRFEYSSIECSFALDSRDKLRRLLDGIITPASSLRTESLPSLPEWIHFQYPETRGDMRLNELLSAVESSLKEKFSA